MDKDAIVNTVLEGCAAHLESKAKEYYENMESEADVVSEVLRQEAKTIRESHSKYDEVRILETNEDSGFTLTNAAMSGMDRRFKVLPMVPGMLFSLVFNCLAGRDKEMFTKISALTIEGLPADVRIEGVAYDPQYSMILLRLHSSIWPVVESNDIPILKWDKDIKVASRDMLLQPYTSIDLLEIVNEARSKLGMEHLSFQWSERPIWLRDLLLLQGDTPGNDVMQVNMSSTDGEQVVGEVFAKEPDNG